MADTKSDIEAEADHALAELAPEFLDRMNEAFEDAVLLVGRVLGGHPEATTARATALDPTGVELTLSDPAGEHCVHVAFANEVTDPLQVSSEALDLVARAQEISGEEATTSIEETAAEMAEIRTFLTEVVAVEDVNPHLRRITFGGGDLTTFTPKGPDTFLYVLLPPPGRTELTIDQTFTWERCWEMPDAERPVGAYYTLRRWRAEKAELDMLFVLHDEAGPASRWAEEAKPGDPVALWGPRSAYAPPEDTDWYLLVADETGLPAVASILERLPAGTPARVFAEVEGPEEHQVLPASPDFEVTWLHRAGAPPGTTTLLADAVQALAWPGGRPYVWGGGESHAMTAVRKHVRQDVGLDREAVSLVAYWRHAG